MTASDSAGMRVTDIPLPWRHPWGTVVDVEYPEDRPLVVDLVFSRGTRTAETRTAVYVHMPDGSWDSAMAAPEGGEPA